MKQDQGRMQIYFREFHLVWVIVAMTTGFFLSFISQKNTFTLKYNLMSLISTGNISSAP
jgi:hypothetical protein